MKNLLLLFHTLRHLKWLQFYYRVYRKVVNPRVKERFDGVFPVRSILWQHTALYAEKITVSSKANFLNYSKTLSLPADWNDESHSKLWVYNLHYFEDLLSVNAAEKREFHQRLLTQWVKDNPEGQGNGWEPYPISLRISNVLKAWQSGFDLDEVIFESLYAQASFLSNDLEKHLLGNHYFVNLKALLFAGVVFDQPKWLRLAEKGFAQEIPEQILEDGFNFELTPMYHSLILVDMLDMYNLCQAYPERVAPELTKLIKSYIPRMLNCMEVMSHPDGGVSLFNDSADGIAPLKERIAEYAQLLGFEVKRLDIEKPQVFDLPQSGYMVATNKGVKVFFDAANVGPDYIPGHAHADTLSFEMSVGCERVFVNTGTSQYGLGEERLTERKTISHNTVELDGKDSSQVWSSFRVAKRARVTKRLWSQSRNKITLSAAHNGYKTLFGGAIHARELTLSENTLVVLDKLKGDFNSGVARFYFNADLSVSLSDGELLVRGDSFELRAALTGKHAVLVDTQWHPQFGISKPNKCLEIHFEDQVLITKFVWTKK